MVEKNLNIKCHILIVGNNSSSDFNHLSIAKSNTCIFIEKLEKFSNVVNDYRYAGCSSSIIGLQYNVALDKYFIRYNDLDFKYSKDNRITKIIRESDLDNFLNEYTINVIKDNKSEELNYSLWK